MHKEVYLEPSNYPELGLELDTLAEKVAKPLPQLFALKTRFGRAVVVDRVPATDAETWAFCLQHATYDHRYYELTHDALGHQFEHYYLLLKDQAGNTRAIQPFLVVNQDLVTGMPKPVRRVVEKLRQHFSSALVMRMLMVGSSAGEGHLVRDRVTGGVEWVAQALRETLQAVARGMDANMIVFKDFPKNYRSAMAGFDSAGYTRVPSMPGSRLDLHFKDFEEYLSTRLSHKTRKNLRYKYRKAATGPAIDLQVVSDITPYIDEVFPLYQQVLERSHYKFEELTRSYFLDLGQRMNDRSVFFIWRQNGKAVAFSSCLCHEGVLRDHYIGLDYEVALEHHLYFVTWRDIFTWALKNGCHTYYCAPLNYEPKYHLRHDLVPLDLYVRSARNWINPLFRLIVPYLEPTRYDPIIRRFANAHELW